VLVLAALVAFALAAQDGPRAVDHANAGVPAIGEPCDRFPLRWRLIGGASMLAAALPYEVYAEARSIAQKTARLTLFRYFAQLRNMSQVLKAIADPTRRKVLELLRRRPMTAGELAEHFDVLRPTMSVHFKVLKEADLVHADKHGTSITYSLKMSVLEEALMGLAHAFRVDLPAEDKQDENDKDQNKEADA
jgi:DNA-binding transcriptional ArsR family regulator